MKATDRLLLMGLCALFLQNTHAVEFSRNETVDPAAPSGELLQRGIVEEISASDLEYYGLDEGPAAPDDRFPIRAKLGLEGYYDSNVFLNENGAQDDFIWEIRPEIYYESGNPDREPEHYFTVGYNPRFAFFTNLTDEDTQDHAGYAQYRYTGDKGSAGIRHSSANVTGANADVGRRVARDEHRTVIDGDYQLTGKMFVESSFAQTLRFNQNLNDYHTWVGDSFLLYEVLPKLKIGTGPRIGWVDVSGGPNQTFQQALIKLIYDPTPKLQLVATGGAEFRQFQGGRDQRVTPAMALGFVWQPRDGTTWSVNGYRNISASTTIFGTNFVATGFKTTFRQRVTDRFFYNLGGGFENAEYQSTVSGGSNNRVDDYYYIRNSLDYDFWEYGTVSVYHQFEENASENSATDFDRHQVGVVINLAY